MMYVVTSKKDGETWVLKTPNYAQAIVKFREERLQGKDTEILITGFEKELFKQAVGE